MPLTPTALAEAKAAAELQNRNVRGTWGHLVAAANGGAVTAANFATGVQQANTEMLAIEVQCRAFRPNLVRWGALPNYNPQFVAMVDNVGRSFVRETAALVIACRRGDPQPAAALEFVRVLLNRVIDIYNFGTYAQIPPYQPKK